MTDESTFAAHGFAVHSPNVWARGDVVIHKGRGFGRNAGLTEYRVHAIGAGHAASMGAHEVTSPGDALAVADALDMADSMVVDVVSWSLALLRDSMGTPSGPTFSEQQRRAMAEQARHMLAAMLRETVQAGRAQ